MSPASVLPDESTSMRSLVSLLASTLGWDKGHDSVSAAMRRLGMRGDLLTYAQAFAVLDDISLEPGIVGVTARFARSRADFIRALGPVSSRTGVQRVEAPPSSRSFGITPAKVTKLDVRELVPLLAHTMGQEKGAEAIAAALSRLGLPEDQLDLAQASFLFEDLASQAGLVGITARFAKARMILKFGA